MKKFLALVLSFSLISGSVSPAYADIWSHAFKPIVTRQLARGAVASTPMQLGIYNNAVAIFRTQVPQLLEKISLAPTLASSIPVNLNLSTLLDLSSSAQTSSQAAQMGTLLSSMTQIGLGTSEKADVLQLAQAAAQFNNTCFSPLMDIMIARTYARNEMYEELNAFILEKKPSGQFWVDLKEICNESGQHITAPVGEGTGEDPLAAVSQPLQEYLSQYGELTSLCGDLSKEATRLYINVGKSTVEDLITSVGIRSEEPLQVQAAPKEGAPAVQGEGQGAAQIAAQQATFSPIMLGQQATPVLPPQVVEESSLQTTQVTQKVPSTIKEGAYERVSAWADWVRNTLSVSSTDNKQARVVLNKPQPLPTHLRDVVLSNAAATFKIQALLKLYEQGIFNDFLATQPAAVKANLINAETEAQRGRALYRLYQTKYLEEVLSAITDVQEQGSVLKELERVMSQENWEEEARRAYAAEDRLPSKGGNFDGVVPSVPEADKDVILSVVRPAGYAKANASSGVASKKGTFYANNIPFYYRNSKGELSSEPVGILTQIPASLYGRILSFMRLASQPGFTIPEGFVLALDEKGQWKFFTPKGNLAITEANPHSRKVLEEINEKGSARLHLDTNYSSTDMLAMAHLLEANPTLNLELALNTPHSLKQFLTAHALFVGNDAGNTLTGPFKESLKTAAQGVVNMVTNLLGGVGYATPIAGGAAMPTMSRWGNAKTTKVIYASAAAALAFSVGYLKMYGTVDPTSLPLAALAVPTVALVLGASLANSFIPTFLNFYKDPATRTAANLDFSTKKQISRLALSGIIAGAAGVGLNWTIVAPIGLGLLGVSYALFRNTPMYREATPQKKKDPNEDKYVAEYQDFRKMMPEMKAIKSRVKMVYASYAASLMILGQSANAVLPSGWGQGFITACMLATLGVRMTATKLVKKNIMTDDQLTGLSLPTLALSGAALTLLPFNGPLAILTGIAGILHYMATAVPGQLDAARMQNIVTAEMQRRKQAVLDDASLTPAQKEEAVKLLEGEEKVWSAQASKDYSLYNSRGLWGIGVAAAAAFLFEDLGPQWTQQILEWISNIYPGSDGALSLDRLLFGYSTAVASALALKNLHLTRDGLNFFRKKKPITMENIEAHAITPKEFGITKNNAQIQLGDIVGKRIKDLEPKLVEYGVYSEQKMTTILTQLQAIHNRLVAITDIIGPDATRLAFQREADMLIKFADIMAQPQNDFSVMLHREFNKMQSALFEDGAVRETPSYVEENIYTLPQAYDSYESARRVLGEMDQMAYTLQSGAAIDYQQFVDYMIRAREDLIVYEKANTADAVRVKELRRKMDNLCTVLAQQDQEQGLLDILPTDTPTNKAGKQAMRDMLSGYLEN